MKGSYNQIWNNWRLVSNFFAFFLAEQIGLKP